VKRLHKDSPARFLLVFILFFLFFYYFNIFFFGVTTPGNHYNAFLDQHLNYIRALRHLLLDTTQLLTNLMGFSSISNDDQLLVAGRGIIDVVYSCLGLGVMSFFTAFVIAYPKRLKPKLIFLLVGLIGIQLCNILRFVLLALFWDKKPGRLLDHHTIFNVVIYALIAVSLYFWVKQDDLQSTAGAKN
jgi:exosortase/archaeosortase family protein